MLSSIPAADRHRYRQKDRLAGSTGIASDNAVFCFISILIIPVSIISHLIESSSAVIPALPVLDVPDIVGSVRCTAHFAVNPVAELFPRLAEAERGIGIYRLAHPDGYQRIKKP